MATPNKQNEDPVIFRRKTQFLNQEFGQCVTVTAACYAMCYPYKPMLC